METFYVTTAFRLLKADVALRDRLKIVARTCWFWARPLVALCDQTTLDTLTNIRVSSQWSVNTMSTQFVMWVFFWVGGGGLLVFYFFLASVNKNEVDSPNLERAIALRCR